MSDLWVERLTQDVSLFLCGHQVRDEVPGLGTAGERSVAWR